MKGNVDRIRNKNGIRALLRREGSDGGGKDLDSRFCTRKLSAARFLII